MPHPIPDVTLLCVTLCLATGLPGANLVDLGWHAAPHLHKVQAGRGGRRPQRDTQWAQRRSELDKPGNRGRGKVSVAEVTQWRRSSAGYAYGQLLIGMTRRAFSVRAGRGEAAYPKPIMDMTSAMGAGRRETAFRSLPSFVHGGGHKLIAWSRRQSTISSAHPRQRIVS